MMINVYAKKKKKKSLVDIMKILSKIRIALLGNSLAKEICEEHNKNESILNGVPIDFSSKIDVSAKTTNGRIVLNTKLIDGSFEILMRYVIHELVHVMQHIGGESTNKRKNYLNRDQEVEAFQYQIEFDSKNRSEDDAVEYVEGLLEFHDIPEKDRGEKEEELMEKVD